MVYTANLLHLECRFIEITISSVRCNSISSLVFVPRRYPTLNQRKTSWSKISTWTSFCFFSYAESDYSLDSATKIFTTFRYIGLSCPLDPPLINCNSTG